MPDHSHTQAEAAELWDNTGMVPSTSPLLPCYLCFLPPRKTSCRWFFLDLPCGTLPVDALPCHLPWQLSETPLWLALLPLCCTALEASAEQKLQAQCMLVTSTTAGSYLMQYVPLEWIKCNTHLPLPLGFKKSKERKSRLFILSYTKFFK